MTTDRYRQAIPRPHGARRKGSPPWEAGIPLNPTVEEIAAVLDPLAAVAEVPAGTSAVLLPLIERPDGLGLLFIRRAMSLSRDAGHIAFPGGRRDGDESMLETALRETEEEIGLDRSSVMILGALPLAFRSTDLARVIPFVGAVEGNPTLEPSPDEVDAILEVPLSGLFAGGVAWEELWSRNDVERLVAFFADETLFGDDLLWGLSARITWELLERIWSGSPGQVRARETR